MFLAIITLLVALSISSIAAWYSIVGLTAIFAAAVFPIILMGAVLEVGKIILQFGSTNIGKGHLRLLLVSKYGSCYNSCLLQAWVFLAF